MKISVVLYRKVWYVYNHTPTYNNPQAVPTPTTWLILGNGLRTTQDGIFVANPEML